MRHLRKVHLVGRVELDGAGSPWGSPARRLLGDTLGGGALVAVALVARAPVERLRAMIGPMLPIGVLRIDRAPAARVAAMSASALDRPLHHGAELIVATVSDDAVVLGAMQRASEITGERGSGGPLLRRGSCGAEVRVGPGTLWAQLALERSDVLVACEPGRLLNRYVRPLLRALAKVGVLAHYFDRDWISVAKRPAGMIAFAHDSGTGRALVEAVIAVRTPFAIRARPSYLGKAPATLADLGADVDIASLADAIVDAYGAAYGRSIVEMAAASELDAQLAARAAEDPQRELPWAATRNEAIGIVGAGRDRAGRMRVGGELMVSRDALATLEQRLATREVTDVGQIVNEALRSPGVALLGVRSLVSVRDVIALASRAP